MLEIEKRLQDKGLSQDLINDLIVIYRGNYNRYIFLGYSKETYDKIFMRVLYLVSDRQGDLVFNIDKKLNSYFKKHIRLQAEKRNVVILDNLVLRLNKQTSDLKVLLKIFWRELKFNKISLDEDYFRLLKENKGPFYNLIKHLGIEDFSLGEVQDYISGKYETYRNFKPVNMTLKETRAKVQYYNSLFEGSINLSDNDMKKFKLMLNYEAMIEGIYQWVLSFDSSISREQFDYALIHESYDFTQELLQGYNEYMLKGHNEYWNIKMIRFIEKVQGVKSEVLKVSKSRANSYLAKSRLEKIDKKDSDLGALEEAFLKRSREQVRRIKTWGNTDILRQMREELKEKLYVMFPDEREILHDLKAEIITTLFGQLEEKKQQAIGNYLENYEGDKKSFNKAIASLKGLYNNYLWTQINLVLQEITFLAFDLKISVRDDLKFDDIYKCGKTLESLEKKFFEQNTAKGKSFKGFYRKVLKEVLLERKFEGATDIIYECVGVMERELEEQAKLILKK